MIPFYYAGLTTIVGTIQVKASEQGVHALYYTEQPVSNDLHLPAVLKQTLLELQEYFNGERQQFTVPLHPAGTTFQMRVWEQLQRIPYGETVSYAQLSEDLGDAKAVRAVAHANGANPIPILIPCHRVIASNGKLTGYSGGLSRKQTLLDLESRYSGKRLLLF